MDFAPQDFTKMNLGAVREAKLTIKDIVQSYESVKRRASVIVDVGCGTGNVTKLLSDEVQHDKLIGVDIDGAMIGYAKSLHIGDNTKEFFIQDFGQPWTELDSRLLSLENKVDLIFSNFCIHWISDVGKAPCVQNIYKLLKDGGEAYMTIAIIKNIHQHLSLKEQRELYSKYGEDGVKLSECLQIPSREEQINLWVHLFLNQGFKSVQLQPTETSGDYETYPRARLMSNKMCTFIRQYWKTTPAYDEKLKDCIWNEFMLLFWRHNCGDDDILSVDEIENRHHFTVKTIKFKCVK